VRNATVSSAGLETAISAAAPSKGKKKFESMAIRGFLACGCHFRHEIRRAAIYLSSKLSGVGAREFTNS
jgi:hypothetical protein